LNFRSTLFIILVLVGIAVTYFLLLPKPADEKGTHDKPRIFQVYDLPRDDINKVRLSYNDNAYQTLTVENINDKVWMITTPIKAHADIKKVNEMLDDFLNKRVRQTFEVSEYGQYGLENPTITVELWKDINSSPNTFFIGNKGINFSVYTKEKSESDIFIIESSALDDLTKSPSDIRDKSLIKFDPETISEIQYLKPEEFTCEKDGFNWKITHPISTDADTEDINTMLTQLHSIQVSTFELDGQEVTSALDKYGLKTPRIQLTMTDGSNTYGLDIGSPIATNSELQSTKKGNVYVKSIHQGGIYTVTEDIVTLLNKTIFDLRDKRLLDFQRKDVIKFEIQYETHNIIGIKLQDTSWELQLDNKLSADPQAVSDLLFGMDSLEAVAYENEPSDNLRLYELETPKTKVILTLRGDESPIILDIGKYANDNTVYVKANNSDRIAKVKRDLIDKINRGVSWLRDKDLFKFSIDDPTRVTVQYREESDSNANVQYTSQRLGTNWRLTHPVKENAKNAEINALLYELIDLKVEQFVSSNKTTTDSTTGFNSPQIQITIKLRSQKTYTLQIGELDESGKYFARLLNQPEHIFLLNDKLIPKLKTKLEWLRTPE